MCIYNILLTSVLFKEGESDGKTSLTGTEIGVDVTANEKLWNTFLALGNIAFAYAFSVVLVEIQVSFHAIICLI